MIIRMLSVRHGRKEGLHGSIGSGAGRDLFGKYYCGVAEVMEYLGCKENKAYELIRELREELIEAGKLTPAYPQGKVPRKVFFGAVHD